MRTWIECTEANGQINHVNLDNATTLSRDEVRHRGTIIGPTDALTICETPEEILKAPGRAETLMDFSLSPVIVDNA